MILSSCFETFKIFIVLVFVISCSQLKRAELKKSSKSIYRPRIVTKNTKENAGDFTVEEEYGAGGKFLFKKREVYSTSDPKKKILEKSISFSTPGKLSNGMNYLRPNKSQYIVWFDGVKHSTITKVLPESRSLEIKTISPDGRNKKLQNVKFPQSNGIYCYFFQLIECVSVLGFIDKAIQKKNISLDLFVIWEGFPFINEQYTNMPAQIFSSAVLDYDGVDDQKNHKFSLKFGNQIIIYILDKNFKFSKMFWVAQGLSTSIISIQNRKK